MKKVFHFVSTNILSGLENMVINISTLVKGYDYTYVSPNGPINDYLNKLNIKHISINRMTPFNVRKIINEYNPDIVLGHDVKASVSLAFNHGICAKNNIKIISELHSDDPRMHEYSLRSLVYQYYSKFYDQIIVVSKEVINNYIFCKFIKDKTIIIDNIINVKKINDNVKFINECSNYWDCIFIGRLSEEKNPLLFIKIILDLKKYKENISAVMIGDGPLKQSCINLINKYNLSNNIDFLGFQFNPYKYLYNSKILLMPSEFEGFGLVAIESFAVGTPVIASPVGGLKGIINEKCGYFANNKNDFVKYTYKLLFNNNLYNNKKNYTNVQLNKINNVDKFIHQYKKIYDNI